MKVDPGVRARAVALVAAGCSGVQAADTLGVWPRTVHRWAKLAGMTLQRGRLGGLAELRRPRMPPACVQLRLAEEDRYVEDNGRLGLSARVLIGLRLGDHHGVRAIARELGVHPSTVSREIARGAAGPGGRYLAQQAHDQALERRKRPKVGKLAAGSALRHEVARRLDAKHSPQQIAARLRLDFPDRDDMQVSHETIYQALYVQGAGSLRHELTVEKALRQGRTSRRPTSRLGPRAGRSWIGDATIANRPAEVQDRAVPGHWEGDLVIGSDDTRAALITLNERSSRFTLISRITVHDAQTVTDRLTEMITDLPRSLIKSLTWDQGVEMANHSQFTVATGCPVYFCDPHAPWQRPTNENGNGLIRDFYPKGTDFTTVNDDEIAQMQHLLNSRPRKVLEWATPAETLDQLLTVASTP